MSILKRLQLYTFYLLLITLPVQLGLHFWTSWSLVNGLRLDYFSPTPYLTDILVGILFALRVVEVFRNRPKFIIYHLSFIIYILIGLFVYFNIKSSFSPFVSLYKWLKVLEFSFLVYWIATNIRWNVFYAIAKYTSYAVIYSSVLALWQFISQSSIGGLWYFLGERTFNSSTPGIANAYINGQLLLRPYATFPHPNVLGGFLVVVLPLIYWNIPHISRIIPSPRVALAKWGRRNTAVYFWYSLVLILGISTLFLTLSRSAILVGIIALFLAKILKNSSSIRRLNIPAYQFTSLLVYLLAGLLLLFLLFPRLSALKVETEPILARQQFNNLAIREFVSRPLFGTGLGTSPLYTSTNYQLRTTNYSLVHQPVHNIYLLLLSETGLVGFLVFTLIVLFAIKHLISNFQSPRPNLVSHYPLLLSIFSILILGLFDHYFLTLQQGQLLLAIMFGLSLKPY